jgi:DNA uptake protein ComE-like DNA-binding protein
LVRLKGIGPSFAKRIIKYRELLGGYISKSQVLEVYGMDSARFIPIEIMMEVDTTVRSKMNLNSVDAKELMRHPYLDKNQAVAIVNYRQQHGPFKAITDLQKIHLVKGETYRKIAPYLTVP